MKGYQLDLIREGEPPDGAPPHLLGLLELAVRMRLTGMSPDRLADMIAAGRAGELAQVIAEKGDVLMFRGKKGESAHAFNALAEAITLAACMPGGVRFLGYRWIAGPPGPIRIPMP